MEIVLRSTVVFLFLWGLTRALGKRELSELTGFEMILLIVIGDLVQQGVTQEDMSITGAMLAVGTMAMLVMIFSYAGFRSRRAERALGGLPVVIMRDGAFEEEILRIERVPVNEVIEAAREHGIADLRQIRLAVLEADGKFSFISDDARTDDGGGSHRAT